MANILGLSDDAYAKILEGIRGVQTNLANGGTVNGKTEDQNLANVYKGGENANKPVIPSEYIQGVLSRASQDDANDANKNKAVVDTGGGGSGVGTPSGGSSGGSSSNSNADYINSIYQNNLASQRQALEKQRQIQLQGLNGQETSANQNALQNLNNNDSLANTNLKQLQEVMANNGVRGGDVITSTIGNQTAQQNGANSINQTKANQLQNINEQRSLINNNASADDLALLQKLQAARDGQMIDNNNTQQNYQLNLAQLMGKTANGQNTLGGNQLALQQQGQNFSQNLQTNQYNQDVSNTKFNQDLQTNAVTYKAARDAISDKQYQQTFEQNAKQLGFENAIKRAVTDNQISTDKAQLLISQQNANTSAASQSTSSSRLAWEQSDKNPDNIYKNAQIDALKNKGDKPPVIDPKVSADNVTIIDGDLKSAGSAAKANQLIEANKDNLTDADYKALKKSVKDGEYGY